MKITAKTATAALVLGDDSKREFIRDFLPSQTRSSQVAERLRATAIIAYDRFNRRTDLTWTVEREHASVAAALAFAADHPSAVPNQADLEITDTTSTAATRYLLDAVISSVRCVAQYGASTIHTYTAVGGEMLKAKG